MEQDWLEFFAYADARTDTDAAVRFANWADRVCMTDEWDYTPTLYARWLSLNRPSA